MGYKRLATYTETLEILIEAEDLADAMDKFDAEDYKRWLIRERFIEDTTQLTGPSFVEVQEVEIN